MIIKDHDHHSLNDNLYKSTKKGVSIIASQNQPSINPIMPMLSHNPHRKSTEKTNPAYKRIATSKQSMRHSLLKMRPIQSPQLPPRLGSSNARSLSSFMAVTAELLTTAVTISMVSWMIPGSGIIAVVVMLLVTLLVPENKVDGCE